METQASDLSVFDGIVGTADPLPSWGVAPTPAPTLTPRGPPPAPSSLRVPPPPWRHHLPPLAPPPPSLAAPRVTPAPPPPPPPSAAPPSLTLAPPSLPPLPAPPSLMPASPRQPPLAAAPRPGRVSARWMLAAVLVLASAASLTLWVTSPTTGVLDVNVEGSGDSAVDVVSVFIDDVETCTRTPCRIEELAAGIHTLRVTAPGFQRPAARALVIQAGATATADFTLLNLPDPRPLARLEPATAIRATPLAALDTKPDLGEDGPAPALLPSAHSLEGSVARHVVAGTTRVAAGRAPTKTAPTPESSPAESAAPTALEVPAPEPATVGTGSIHVNSIPVTAVLVDGKPVGQTPGRVTVSSGAHSVTFVHPELGRRSLRVQVPNGGTAVASTRF